MKLAYASDIHLEFGDITLENSEGADILVLAGDVCVNSSLSAQDSTDKLSVLFHRFFKHCAEQFPMVLYVAGNHEHYNGDFAKTVDELKSKLAYLPNLHILDNQSIVVEGITFIGGTLWTNMNNEDPLTMYGIRSAMNDFRCIKNSNNSTSFRTFDDNGVATFHNRVSRFSPQDAVNEHNKMLRLIDNVCNSLSEPHKVVVIGHHTPTFECCAPEYKHDTVMNGGFHSELSEFILDHPLINVWFCGHVHNICNIEIGSTKVLCNPRGYFKYERRSSEFTLMYVDV